MNAKRFLYITVTFVLLASVFWLSAGADQVPPKSRALTPKKVRVATLEQATASRMPRFSATLRAADRADLAFTLPGRMMLRPVRIGDAVAAGQLVAQLDREPLENQREAAAAALADVTARWRQAQRDLERTEALVASKAATAEELEHVRAREASLLAAHRSASTQLQERERQLREASLFAPFDAVVTEVFLQEGEFAGAGMPVVKLAGRQHLEMEVEVPESIVSHLRPGDEVDVVLPFSGERVLKGTLRTTMASSGRPGRLFPVVVDLPEDPKLAPGMTAYARFSLAPGADVMAPVAAVINPGGSQPEIFVVEDNRVRTVPVQVGRLQGERVSLSGAIKAGDTVAVGGFFGLIDGDVVEVLQ